MPKIGRTTVSDKTVKLINTEGIKGGVIKTEDWPSAKAMLDTAKGFPLCNSSRACLFWMFYMEQWQFAQAKSREVDIVVLDGFWAGVIAYNIDGKQIPKSVLDRVKKDDSLKPDLVLFLDISVPEAISSGNESTTFKNPELAEKVRTEYRKLALSDKWICISASAERSLDDIAKDCFQIIWDAYRKKMSAK